MPVRLGQLIRDRRQELGLTQEALAERIGDNVRQAEVSRLEAGRVALPRRLRMEQLARALELPLGELLLGSGWVGAEDLEAASDAPGAADDPLTVTEQMEQSVRDLTALNADLQDTVDDLQLANTRLQARGADKDSALRIAEAIVAQLRAVLNALPDPVVVVSRAGVVITENTAYAAFSARHTDVPVMSDAAGVRMKAGDLPLERAARGERFAITVGIDDDGQRVHYRVTGEPASTLQGGLLGVVTFHPIKPPSPA